MPLEDIQGQQGTMAVADQPSALSTETPEPVDVCVIGAGITGLTTAFHLIKKGRSVRVVEKANRIGGQIHTHRVGDFVVESGPNTGAISYPEIVELFNALDGDCQLETARASSKRRLIWKGDRFRELPSGLIGGLRTPLFTWYDKFRILGEPFRAKGTNPDESVGELAARRLGRSYLDYAVDPFVSGVYAGNPMTLVTRYALPKLYNLEQTYGGFIRGAMAKAREPKSDRDRLATKQVFSAKGGLEHLVQALGAAIGPEHITTGANGVQVFPDANGYEVRYITADGMEHRIACRKVVTTCGAYALPALLPFVDERLMKDVSNLFYAPIVQVGVGIRNTGGRQYQAFGGLVPSCERQQVLGILFPSACFEGRAPEHGAVFSFFLGGVRHQEFISKTDDELTDIVDDALHRMLQLPKHIQPDVLRIFRHHRAIPQYEVTSGARFAAIDKVEQRYPGLVLAGNLKGGIGMADRIRQAVAVAKNI